MLLGGPKPAACDPFAEFRKDREATKAKYRGKSVLLHGVVTQRYVIDEQWFLRCAGPNKEAFHLVVDNDFYRVKVNHRIIVKAQMNEEYSGRCGDPNETAWSGRLEEIQEITSGRGWRTIWKR